MHNEIKFSVIIPTYNRAGLIMRTLQTVFEQTYTNYEVIVVDNCSEDNTEQLLEPLVRDEKIRYIRHDRDYERAKSRNTGMQHAGGDFLTFLDSDDLLYKNSLELVAGYIKTHPDVKFLHHFYEMVDPEGKRVYRFGFSRKTRKLKDIVKGNFLSCIGVFIAKEIYTRYRFDESPQAIGSEDWDFWVRVMTAYELAVIPVVAAAIVQHAERSVSAMQAEKVLARKDYFIGKYKAQPELARLLNPYFPSIKACFYQYAATFAFSAGQWKKGYGYLCHAIRSDPSFAFLFNYWKVTLSPVKKIFTK